MRKIYMAILLVMAILIISIQGVFAATSEVTDVRWVTRNDAPISYVRLVLDLTSRVNADATITKDGLSTKVVLKNTSMKDAPKRMTLNPDILKSVVFAENGNDLHITLQTPNSIEPNDIKVFQLKRDETTKKPIRLVIDVKQKNVKPRDHYFGMEQNKVDAKQLDENIKRDPKKKIDLKKQAKISNFKTNGGIKGKIIAIDPGHGGTDVGAPGVTNGVYEKNITLPIALKLEKLLKEAGAKVVLTRRTDKDVYGPHSSGPDELQARTDVGNDNNADIFISIHINSFTNPKVGGIAAYYFPKTEFDKKIASKIGAKIVTEPGFGGDRGINEAGFYVLKHTTMPATLVELGFISNPDEEQLLLKEKVQEEFAKLIFDGIISYFQG